MSDMARISYPMMPPFIVVHYILVEKEKDGDNRNNVQ